MAGLPKSGVELTAQGAAAFEAALRAGDTAVTGFGQATEAAAKDVASLAAAAQRAEKITGLNDKLSAQSRELNILQQELAKTAAKYGEASTQAQRKEAAIASLGTAIAATERKIESETQAQTREAQASQESAQALAKLEAQAQQTAPAIGKVEKEAEQAAPALNKTGIEATQAAGAVDKLGREAQQASGKVSAFGEALTGAFRHMGTLVVDGVLAAGRAVGRFATDTISQAADFESGMNRFASITGSAIGDAGMQIEDFSALFLKLGADTQFSAGQAQEAAINLAKGGLTPAMIAGGALADTLTLAAAGELDLAKAADITAKQLGVWASAGVTSAQIADLLAQAANASTVGVDDLAMGLANVGGIAKVAGLSFEETVQAMALLAPGFSSAADAGTSFKTFLTRLQPTTSTAAGAMLNLGLLTEEGTSKFYDAEGSFIGMGAAAQLLQDSLSGLTEAQKVTALQAIFGQDAFRAAALIAEQGAAGYDKMGASMDAAGTAAEQAAERNKGFKFALDTLLGSIDTLKVVLGTALLPLLTTFVNEILTPAINGVMTFASAFQTLWPHIMASADPLNSFFNALRVTLPGALPFIRAVQDAFNMVAPAITFVKDAIQPLIDLIGANLVPVLAATATVIGGGLLIVLGGVVAGFVAVAAPVIAAIAALALLYANIGPIQEALARFGNTEWGQAIQRGAAIAVDYFTGPFVGEVSAGVGVVIGKLQEIGASPWGQAVQQTGRDVAAYFAGPFAGDLAAGVGVAQSKLAELGASEWSQQLQRGAQVASNYFSGPFVGELTAGVGVVQSKLAELGASPWWQALSQGAQTVANMFVTYMGVIYNTVSSTLQQVVGFVSSHASELQAIFTGTWSIIASIVTAGTQVILGVIRATMQLVTGDWTSAWNTIKTTTSTLVEANVSAIRTALSILPAIISTIFDAVVSTISGFVGQFSDAGANLVEGIADGIRGAASSAINAAVSVATDALSAVQSALGMQSPSRVAAEEIGTPFVMGIVEGIEDSADMLKDMARQLSEQLVDDMALVGEAAAEAFKDMFAAGLAGTAGIARQRVKNLRDVAKLDDGGKAVTGIKGEQAALKEKRGALTDAQRAAVDAAAEKRQAINEKAAEAELARQGQIADIKRKSDTEEAERKRKIAAILADSSSEENKQRRINDLNITYADQEAERQDRITEINATSAAAKIEQTKAIAAVNDALAKQQETYRQQFAKMDSEELTLKHKLLAAEQLRATLLERQAATRKELADAEAFAATFTDPELGAKYFKEESARIMELADLRRDYIAATTLAEKAALTQQMRQIEEAQRAEKALFAATASEQSKTFDDVQKNLQTVLEKLQYEAKRDLGISKMDIGKENQASAYAEYLRDLEAIKKIEALLATVSAPIRPPAGAAQIAAQGVGSTTNTSNWNFSYATQQSMGSVQQDIAIAQALAGV